MTLDIFSLRDRVVDEYRGYVESFVNILDPRVSAFVRERLEEGELWPEAVLQLNPAYQAGRTMREIAAAGEITAETARFFGPDIRLHQHQEEALAIARRPEPYVVSTGTGSGKSLTYLIPIVDHIFRNRPEEASVRAIVVYPMNALINSQIDALGTYVKRNWAEGCPIRFGKYTGEVRDEARREILNDPPHILLTNYVMLEYLLIRPEERVLVDQATRNLAFLAMDEMHVYRGRQGADVAMLIRRLRQRSGRNDLLCIGTSATLATNDDREAQRRTIAEAGGRLFGTRIPTGNVIDETLERIATVPVPATEDAVRAAVEADPPPHDLNAVRGHPLVAWAEETFGLAYEDGRLIRRAPITVEEGLGQLVEVSGRDEELCRARLTAAIEAGNAVIGRTGDPIFAFRLHQFLSSGGSIYATIDDADRRELTTSGQYFTGPPDGDEERHVLYPLTFCRECGQEYYLGSLATGASEQRMDARSPLLNAAEDEMTGEPGYFALHGDGLWDEAEELPDNWLEWRKSGPRVKERYAPHVPKRLWVRPDGRTSSSPVDGTVEGWWTIRPLMMCLRCRASYDLRQKSDFTKLVTLSQTGRSTATTIVSAASVAALRNAPDVDTGSQKLLSFTDNRQDAALQSGHLNDFAQVVLLRSALVRALDQQGTLNASSIGQVIFDALDPTPDVFMRDPVESGPGLERARRAMIDLLEYRAIEDLARAWRVAQPNLEQCGLLEIDYDGLDAIAASDAAWAGIPMLDAAAPAERAEKLRAVLNHLRSVLVIRADCLDPNNTRALIRRLSNDFRDPWRLDETDWLRTGSHALLPNVDPRANDRAVAMRLGWRSAIGRYLRSHRTWDIEANISTDAAEAMVLGIVEALRGHILSIVEHRGAPYAVQLQDTALIWRRGSGTAPPPDPVRGRSLHLVRPEVANRPANAYFVNLYREQAAALSRLSASEHTGQVAADARERREREFREGTLSILYCSPTMELGIDIRDLAIVHMRNIPRTPANYAQRSGRAGRGGQPALVLAFSTAGNAHDQFYFRHKDRMISGQVAPPRLDLTNRELIEAHLQSVWLAEVGLSLGSSIDDVLDRTDDALPLKADIAARIDMSDAMLASVIAAMRGVLDLITGDLNAAHWYSDRWVEELARAAPGEFNRAFERWRTLYRAAYREQQEARRIEDRSRNRDEREAARRRQETARREIDLLLNVGSWTESDFYTYRYLANEGFIPGYNFPRLPVRALVSSGGTAQAIDRPRFIALSEFGPGNIIYHEGRKHRVESCIIPARGFENELRRAKTCRTCGYIHPDESATVDLCVECGTRLDGETSEFPQRLLEQPTVRAVRRERISSEEEERAREGYALSTHFRVTTEARRRRLSWQTHDANEPVLDITIIPQAELWRINHGWRRATEASGFVLDQVSGRWMGQRDLKEADEVPHAISPVSQIMPFVRDRRNILLMRCYAEGEPTDAFLKSAAYAFRRAVQAVYQVEEQEIAVEIIGQGEHQRILMWEAAEGGIGIWDRMSEDTDALPTLARTALDIMHFDPATGDEVEDAARGCHAACYDCLLSYANQPEHRFLDRRLVRDWFLRLAHADSVVEQAGRSYDEHYAWLRERTDPASTFERDFLDHLHREGHRLPDLTQHRPNDRVMVQTDFYYERDGRPGVCVFIDGPAHDTPDQRERDQQVRAALADLGFRVVAIRHDRGIGEQIAEHGDVFR